MVGATLILKEIEKSAETQQDGSFLFNNIPQGSYILTCSFVGYQTLTKKVSVGEKENLLVDLKLTAQVTQIEQVTITSEFDRSTDISARSSERTANQVMNVISAKTIESLPDLNVADVMQRVSGVSMLKNSAGSNTHVVIRGMPPRYNSTLMNGVAMPNPGSGKSVSLDMFGSELIGRIEVIKALTPDLEGDGIGGAVNMVMKQAPEAAFLKVQASTGYNQYFFNHDFLTFDSKAVSVKDFNELKGTSYVPSLSDFSRKNLIVSSEPALPDMDVSVSFGRRFFKDKLGVMVAGNLQNKLVASTYNSISYNNDIYNNLSVSQWENQTYCKEQKRAGGYAKLDYRINKNNEISLYTSFFQMNEQRARDVVDTLNEDNRTGPGTGTVHSYKQTMTDNSGIMSSILRGNHKITDNLDLDWSMVYSVANATSPDFASVYLVQTISSPLANSPTYLNYSSCITRAWQWSRDEDKSAYLNINYKPQIFNHLFEFKAGGLARMKFRKNYANEYVFNASPDNYKYPNPDILTVPISTKNDQQLQGNAIYNPGNYRAWEDVDAVYAMVKTSFGKLQIVTGARFEVTNMRNEHNQLDLQVPLAHAKFYYWDLLPSLHLIYKLTPTQNLRFSYYQAINRPNYTEVIPYSDIRPGGNTGNPKLKHTLGNCLDLRYELYPDAEGVVTAGIFYKQLHNAIEELVNPGNDSRSFRNVALCTNYGFELVGIKYFGNFGINANYTYTHSAIVNPKFFNVIDSLNNVTTITKMETRPLVGQSPHLINVGLTYRNSQKGFKCSVAYTMQGSHVINVSDLYGKDVYEENYHNLGFTVEQTLYKRLTIQLKVSNLLNYPIQRYTSDGYFIEKLNNYQSYFIGIKYSL